MRLENIPPKIAFMTWIASRSGVDRGTPTSARRTTD
jgi:hypothetical protein